MRFIFLCISLFLWSLLSFQSAFAVDDINIRDTSQVTISSHATNDKLGTFIGPIVDFFYNPVVSGDATVPNIFLNITGAIKNFFITVAVIFLIIGVLKLLFSWGDEEAQKKWKNNIIWVSVWIFIMQISYSVWSTLFLKTWSNAFDINGHLAWTFWINIFEPIVKIMLLLASFGFMAMAVYAFYTIITGWGDEEKLKKWKNIILYAVIGFVLIRIPQILITALYGKPSPGCSGFAWNSVCEIGAKNLDDGINIFGKILAYVNGFLALFAVVMVIYAGWLIFISWGDEEKLKKAKRIMIYIAIGVILLVWTQVIFRFFFLRS